MSIANNDIWSSVNSESHKNTLKTARKQVL